MKDPMLVQLGQAFMNLHTKKQQYSGRRGSTKVSSTTVSKDHKETSKTEIAEADVKIVSGIKKKDKISEEQILLQLLTMPAFLTFVRVMMSLLGFFSRTPALEESLKQHESITKKGTNNAEALHGQNLYQEEEGQTHVFDSISHDAPARGSNH